MNRLSVIGLGKLGAPMLAVFAAAGFEVVGVDTSRDVVLNLINKSAPHVPEPGLSDLLTTYRANYTATTDTRAAVRETDATFIIVPTPTGADGGFVLDYVEPVARDIGTVLSHKDGYHLVVLTSTVMPGQTREIAQIVERESGKHCGEDFGLCYSPEFIALGSVVHDFQNPDYALIGCEDDRAGGVLETIYRRVHEQPIVRMNWVNAEIAKIAQNSYITMKITFANELGHLCGHIPGANADDVTRALGHDRRIGPRYLRAGTAFGGPCFPRDNRALQRAAERFGSEFEIAQVVDSLNMAQAYPFYRLVWQAANKGKDTVGILGLAYKPGTPVIEESAAIELAHNLVITSATSVIVYDPLAMDNARAVLGDSVTYAASAIACIMAADVVVLMHPDESMLYGVDLTDKTIIDPWRVVRKRLYGNGRVHYIPLGVGPREVVTA